MAEAIGERGFWRADALRIEVEIVDVRRVFDRHDVLIRPVAGTGERWVSACTVMLPGCGTLATIGGGA